GHPGMLFVPGGRVDLDASLGSYAGAEDIDDLAVHPDPAVGDPGIGLAARTKAEFAHSLRKSGMIHGTSCGFLREARSLSDPAAPPGCPGSRREARLYQPPQFARARDGSPPSGVPRTQHGDRRSPAPAWHA